MPDTSSRDSFRLTLASVALVISAPAQSKPDDPEDVEKLIDSIVSLESFDTGLSGSFGGSDFPPVAGQHRFGVGLLNDDAPHARHPALPRLVALGPKAIAALLRHLDDRRPTKLVVRHDSGMGGMWYAREVPYRASDKVEREAIRRAGIPVTEAAAEAEEDNNDGRLEKHTVTVGDVCFVIVGMITNRGYNAIRYQPTACRVINSPTKSPAIAGAVRNIWLSAASRSPQRIADQLFTQLRTDLIEEEHYSDGAATRLLYYFPGRAGKLIRARLDRLIAEYEGDSFGLPDFIRSIAWTDEPRVRQRLRTFVLQTDRAEFLEHGALAFADRSDPKNFDHLVRLAAKTKDKTDGAFNDASRELLRVNLLTFPERGNEAVRRFLQGGSPRAAASACWACFSVVNPPIAELIPCLEMRAPGIGEYLILGDGVVEEPEPKDVNHYRVCDNAYETIARALGDRQCRCTGTHEEMDRRIDSLRKRLGEPKDKWPYSVDQVAARQREQNQVRIARQARHARINATAKNPTEVAALSASDPASTFEEVRTACLTLVTPAGSTPPDDLLNLMGNHLDGPPRFSTLPAELRVKTADELSRRLLARLGVDTASYPTTRTVELASLLVRVDAKRGAAALRKCTSQIRTQISEASHPSDLQFAAVLRLLDEMIRFKCSGAGRAFRNVFEHVKPATLTDFFSRDEFIELLANHSGDPDVDQVLRSMFLDTESPFHLSRGDFSLARDFCNQALVRSATFRRALRVALADERIAGQLSLDADGSTGRISWVRKDLDEATVFLDDEEPRGLKAGEGTMAVRHCDAWLNGVARCVFRRHKTPPFCVYWPLLRREAARKAWLEYLAKPPVEDR